MKDSIYCPFCFKEIAKKELLFCCLQKNVRFTPKKGLLVSSPGEIECPQLELCGRCISGGEGILRYRCCPECEKVLPAVAGQRGTELLHIALMGERAEDYQKTLVKRLNELSGVFDWTLVESRYSDVRGLGIYMLRVKGKLYLLVLDSRREAISHEKALSGIIRLTSPFQFPQVRQYVAACSGQEIEWKRSCRELRQISQKKPQLTIAVTLTDIEQLSGYTTAALKGLKWDAGQHLCCRDSGHRGAFCVTEHEIVSAEVANWLLRTDDGTELLQDEKNVSFFGCGNLSDNAAVRPEDPLLWILSHYRIINTIK